MVNCRVTLDQKRVLLELSCLLGTQWYEKSLGWGSQSSLRLAWYLWGCSTYMARVVRRDFAGCLPHPGQVVYRQLRAWVSQQGAPPFVLGDLSWADPPRTINKGLTVIDPVPAHPGCLLGPEEFSWDKLPRKGGITNRSAPMHRAKSKRGARIEG